jgi:hypothetical protein
MKIVFLETHKHIFSINVSTLVSIGTHFSSRPKTFFLLLLLHEGWMEKRLKSFILWPVAVAAELHTMKPRQLSVTTLQQHVCVGVLPHHTSAHREGVGEEEKAPHLWSYMYVQKAFPKLLLGSPHCSGTEARPCLREGVAGRPEIFSLASVSLSLSLSLCLSVSLSLSRLEG